MMDEVMKKRQLKLQKNEATFFKQRAENHKLQLRKDQVDNYIERKRMKLNESPISLNDLQTTKFNPENFINFKELNLNKELDFIEILTRLKGIINEHDNWYGETAILKECVINLRKITCRHLNRDNGVLIENKIHILLFKILEHFQTYVELAPEELIIIHESIWAVNNMVCITNSEIFNEMKRRNSLLVLKNYLYISNEKIVEQVALCLGNIVVESNYFRESALKIGILDRVVILTKDISKPVELVKNCIFVISNILRGKPHPNLEKIAPSLNVISACLWKSNEEIVKMCLWSISYISDGYENIQNTIVSTGCIPKILEFVVMKKKDLHVPSLRILGNLAAGSNKISDKLLESSVVKVVIDLISKSSCEETIKEILWALNNFSLSSIKVINYMIESEKLNRCLKCLIEIGNDEMRYQVLSIYYNFSKNGNKGSLTKLIDLGIIELISFLIFEIGTLNHHTSIMAVGLLNKLIKIDINSNRENEFEIRIYKIITENSLKEKFEYLLVNGKFQVLTELINRCLENIKEIAELNNDGVVPMEY